MHSLIGQETFTQTVTAASLSLWSGMGMYEPVRGCLGKSRPGSVMKDDSFYQHI